MQENISQNKPGNPNKGKRLTAFYCKIETIIEVWTVLNFLIFTSEISFHQVIPYKLELNLLIFLAGAITICNVLTAKGNKYSRVIGAALIIVAYFYNVMDFFVGFSLLGAENWYQNILCFLSVSAICVVKLLFIRNIFVQKDIKAFFVEVDKDTFGL